MMYIFNILNKIGDYSQEKLDENFIKTTDELENEKFIIKTEKWESPDGSFLYTRTTQTSKKLKNKVDVEQLRKELEVAIKKEEFEKAAELRDKIKSLKEEKAS